MGSCIPVSSEDQSQGSAPENSSTSTASTAGPAVDVPLEIAISQFPSGYQGRWALTPAGCTDEPEGNEQTIFLQGRLLKFPDSVGTMTEGKRMTSKTMEGKFAFVGEGDKWDRSISFELSEDRKRLTRQDAGDGSTYRYVQCPKLMAG